MNALSRKLDAIASEQDRLFYESVRETDALIARLREKDPDRPE